jgi:hypothetical protein
MPDFLQRQPVPGWDKHRGCLHIKHLTLNQGIRYGPAIHGDKLQIFTIAVLMDQLRQHTFTGSGLADQQHRALC